MESTWIFFALAGMVALAIFLLSWFQFGKKIELHPKGIIALIACTLGIVISNSYFKYIFQK